MRICQRDVGSETAQPLSQLVSSYLQKACVLYLACLWETRVCQFLLSRHLVVPDSYCSPGNIVGFCLGGNMAHPAGIISPPSPTRKRRWSCLLICKHVTQTWIFSDGDKSVTVGRVQFMPGCVHSLYGPQAEVIRPVFAELILCSTESWDKMVGIATG